MVADKDKIETAPRVSGDENTGDDLKKGQALLKSGLDELGYWDTVKLFWKVSSRAFWTLVVTADRLGCSHLQPHFHCCCRRWLPVHPERQRHCQQGLHQACWLCQRGGQEHPECQLHGSLGSHAVPWSAGCHGIHEPHLGCDWSQDDSVHTLGYSRWCKLSLVISLACIWLTLPSLLLSRLWSVTGKTGLQPRSWRALE